MASKAKATLMTAPQLTRAEAAAAAVVVAMLAVAMMIPETPLAKLAPQIRYFQLEPNVASTMLD